MGVFAVVDVFVDGEGDGRHADYFAGEPADALLEGEGEVSFCGAGEEGRAEGAGTMARIASKSSERVLFWEVVSKSSWFMGLL